MRERTLWTSKEKPETRGAGFPCEAFRTAFVVNADREGVSAGFVGQYKLDGVWHTSHAYAYEVSLNRSFEFSRNHVYYDGPHCSLRIGFLGIHWSGDPRTGWCKKCAP